MRVTAALKRALEQGWYVSTFKAQIVLQSFIKMRSTPEAGIKYSRLPTRGLACIMQANLRRAILSREYAARRDAAVTLACTVKKSVYKMMYYSLKIWCAKTGGTTADLHKLFGKLTTTMDKKGTPFWRKHAFMGRRDERGITYGNLKGDVGTWGTGLNGEKL